MGVKTFTVCFLILSLRRISRIVIKAERERSEVQDMTTPKKFLKIGHGVLRGSKK